MGHIPGEFPEYFAGLLPSDDESELGSAAFDAADGATLPPVQPPPAASFADPTFQGADATAIQVRVLPGPASPTRGEPVIAAVPPGGHASWLDAAEAGAWNPTADAIAAYRPWHLARHEWGVYVNQRALWLYTSAIAETTGTVPERMAPLVLRQILVHEWTHFAYEVVGSELEDVIGRPLYADYILYNFAYPELPRLVAGPLEEVVASHAEVQFAANPSGWLRRLRPRGYTDAVRALLAASPPGYNEWHLMDDRDNAIEIVTGILAIITDRELWSYRVGGVTEEERAQVPVYWVGDPAALPLFGCVPKVASAPNIRVLKKWLRSIGAQPATGGKGSHEKWTLPDGTRIGFATGAGFLLPPEAKRLADRLQLTTQELYIRIGDA